MSNKQKDSSGVSEAPPPERVWITWDDAYPWTTPESGGTEYALVQPPVTQDSSETAERHPYYVHVRNCHLCSGPNGYCSEGLRLLRMPTETAVEINFHKFVGVGAGELGITPCEKCGALERDLIHVDKFRETAGEGVPEKIYVNAKAAAIPMAGVYTLISHDGDIGYVRARAYSPSGRPCSACGDGDTAQRYHNHEPVAVDGAALRRAVEKIVDEPMPYNSRYASFDLRKWKLGRYAQIITTELNAQPVQDWKARFDAHTKAVGEFLSEMAEIYSLDVVLGDDMNVRSVTAELLRVSREVRENMVQPVQVAGIPMATLELLKRRLKEISEHPCPMCSDCILILGNDIIPIVDSVIERLASSPAQVDGVSRALKLAEYTSHTDDCEWWGSIPRTICTCGLATLLEGLDKKEQDNAEGK